MARGYSIGRHRGNISTVAESSVGQCWLDGVGRMSLGLWPLDTFTVIRDLKGISSKNWMLTREHILTSNMLTLY